MDKDYGKKSGEVLAQSDKATEKAIFWCMVVAAAVVVIAGLKGVPMFV